MKREGVNMDGSQGSPIKCPACIARGKVWKGDDPKCAFPNGGSFNTENWNCATMNDLRVLAEAKSQANRIDDCSIGYLYFNNEDGWGWVVMTWYKSRGRCGMATVMDDEHQPKPLTLAVANSILESTPKPPVSP